MTEIVNYLNAEGYPISDFIPDKKIHRFSMGPDDKKNSGYYIGYRNFLQKTGEEFFVAVYGSWHESEPKIYSSLKGNLSPADKKNLDDQIRKAKREHYKQLEIMYEKAAQESQNIWDGLSNEGNSAYVERKGISECRESGARFDSSGSIFVPVRDSTGKLWSLQEIKYDGTKRFHKGGKISGNFHCIGDVINGGEQIYICEGFATAASIFMATGCPVFISFGSGNLPTVSKNIRFKFPERKIIICADNDKSGVGIEKATQAARESFGTCIWPTFSGHAEGTDFNDLALSEGIETVRAQLSQKMPEVPKEELENFNIMDVPYPDEDPKTFKKKGTMVNVNELLRRLKIKVRYNVISKEEEIVIPDSSFTIDNKSNATLAYIIDWTERVGIPNGHLSSYLTAIADRNPFNPVAEWIESKPWDKISRLPEFYDTITAKDEADPDIGPTETGIKETLMKRWLISAVAALYEPNGVSAHGVLVFQGNQNVGKTYWLKRLVPSHLKAFAGGMFLRPDDKDSVYQLVSKWIVELGELDATFKKSDLAMIKAFVTKDNDELRRPYAKKESHFARRTVFAGSVNDIEFLKDPTGNRRFWTIECESINYEHNIDTQQLWAEIREIYLSGEPWILSNGEIEVLNRHNKKFEEKTPIEERIQNYYDWASEANFFKTSTEVCLDLGILNPTQRDKNQATIALRKMSVHESMIHGYRKFKTPHKKASF